MSNSRAETSGPVYLDESSVEDVRQTKPPLNSSRTGYGGKIATSWKIKIGGRWYRVYVMIFSNSGTAYVFVKDKRHLLGSFEPSNFHEPWYQEYRKKHGR